MKYEDITEQYALYKRVELVRLELGSELMVHELISTRDGRILVPAFPEEANLFAVYGFLESEMVLVAEFSRIAQANKFVQQANGPVPEPDSTADSSNEDITEFYRAKGIVRLAEIKNEGHQLFIAELIKTPDGRILIPAMSQHGANLFAVFAATDEISIVASFASYEGAEKFLSTAKSEGWDVLRGRDILPGIRWLGQVMPRSAEIDFPWIQNEFDWMPTKIFWKRWRRPHQADDARLTDQPS
jgi:hypothetical protein